MTVQDILDGVTRLAGELEDGEEHKRAASHADMVRVLKKPGSVIADEMSGHDADLIHMAMGISGEAGELLDAIKKATIYRKPLDLDNVIEELCDLEFYMEGLRQTLDITRGRTLLANIDKLSVRYAAGYSDRAAQVRADKEAA